jgi:hypothetical protein
MSDLYKAAQQALEALESLQGGCTDSNDGTVEAITVWCPEVIEALRDALAQQVESMSGVKDSLTAQAEPVACHWHQDIDSTCWAAGCGGYFTLNGGKPSENDMTHCCYCGKTLVEVPIEEVSDE